MSRTAAIGAGTKAVTRILRSEWRHRRGEARFGMMDNPPHDVNGTPIACAPGLYEPGQIDRVVRCAFDVPVASELEKLEARLFYEMPPVEYRLRDAVIAGGQILTPEARYYLRDLAPLPALRAPLAEYARAALLNSEQGLKYFGHWLRDDCVTYDLSRAVPTLLSMPRPDWPDRHVYETAFGQTWNEVPFAHVADLTVWRDQGFSRDKARRLRRLRARLRAAHPAPNAGKIVFIGRGKLGAARAISNREEVETAFAAAGIRIVEPGADGIALIRDLLDAAMIITVEGSQASHGVYTLADGGALLVLQPPDRFFNPHHEWARLLGMRYGITVGQQEETGFRIDPAEVFAMADRLMAAPRQADA